LGACWALLTDLSDMYLHPEAKARRDIDAALEVAGWMVQDIKDLNLAAGRGVAVREVPLKSGHGKADIAAEIAEDLRSALEQFELILGDLGGTAAAELEWRPTDLRPRRDGFFARRSE
jgi:hypothetical protein